MTPEISIVVPLFNECENVEPLTQRILAAFKDEKRPIELLLVDDASTDETWQRMLDMQKADSRVRALHHHKNSGQSASLWTGFQASRAKIIATLDGDLQNDPGDLPALLTHLDQFDMVVGVRTRRMDNGLRKISSRIARAARKAALGVDFQDTGCNLRVFKRDLLAVMPAFNGIHRFMPVLAHSAGATVKEIPVTHHPRVAGQSKYGLWNRLGRGIYDLIGVRWYQKRQLRRVPSSEHDGGKSSSSSSSS